MTIQVLLVCSEERVGEQSIEELPVSDDIEVTVASHAGPSAEDDYNCVFFIGEQNGETAADCASTVAANPGQLRTDGGQSEGTSLEREQVAAALERVADGYLSVDADGVVTYLNEPAGGGLDIGHDVVGERLDEHAPDSLVTDACLEVRQTGTEVTFEGYDEQLGRWLEGTAYPADGGISVVVRDRTRQRTLRQELEDNETALEQLHDVATDPGRSVEEKIDQMLEIGAERLDTAGGFLMRIEDGIQTVVRSAGEHPAIQPGTTVPLSKAYCRHTIQQEDPLAVSDAPRDGWDDDPAYEQFGLDCYLGVTIHVDDEQYGTVCFLDPRARETPFTERESTFAELLTNWIHYLLEQREYERELEQQQAFTESLLHSLPDLLYAFDDDGELIRWNPRVEEVTGYDPPELEGMTVTDFAASDHRERLATAFAAVMTGEYVSVEVPLETSDGRQIPYEFSGAPLHDETGAITGSVGVGRDVSERKAHQERLAGLLDTTRSLMQARDREHVAEIAVNAARKLLGFDISVFRLYDGETGTLEPAAATRTVRETLGKRPVYEVGEGYPGEVFASGEPQIIRDMTAEDRQFDLEPAKSAMYYPVGVHGTISVCSTERDAFDETDERMLALLATSAASACMRARREQEVREAREHTERVLDRVNGLIENTIEVLVQARTREELEDGVVSKLASAAPYRFAWIGRPDVTSETLTPTAWDGATNGTETGDHNPQSATGNCSFDLTREGDPVSDAYRQGTPQILDGLSERDDSHWSDIAGETGIDAVLVVPLVYRDATYGVLAVCADDVTALDERERVVLEALGRAVANAINAIERGRILDATEIIELEFAIDDRELLFSRLSAETDCTIESAGTEYRPDGRIRLYLSVTDVDPEAFLELARTDDEIDEVTCIVEHETECLVEIVVEESLLATLTEYGAVPRAVTATGGLTRFTVELPYEAEARELFEVVEDRYSGTELLGYHERERPMETRQDFKSALSERLTDRQETAIRTAYLGGFFDWPREVDGNELAEAMDISRPTYHQHLRAAQAKVFEELFE